jgi:hypothetical protein
VVTVVPVARHFFAVPTIDRQVMAPVLIAGPHLVVGVVPVHHFPDQKTVTQSKAE